MPGKTIYSGRYCSSSWSYSVRGARWALSFLPFYLSHLTLHNRLLNLSCQGRGPWHIIGGAVRPGGDKTVAGRFHDYFNSVCFALSTRKRVSLCHRLTIIRIFRFIIILRQRDLYATIAAKKPCDGIRLDHRLRGRGRRNRVYPFGRCIRHFRSIDRVYHFVLPAINRCCYFHLFTERENTANVQIKFFSWRAAKYRSSFFIWLL